MTTLYMCVVYISTNETAFCTLSDFVDNASNHLKTPRNVNGVKNTILLENASEILRLNLS